MPNVYYDTPPFRDYVAQNLKGYRWKALFPWFFSTDLPGLEVRDDQGKLMAKVFSRSVTIVDKSIQSKISDLASQFELDNSSETIRITINVYCEYPKSRTDSN